MKNPKVTHKSTKRLIIDERPDLIIPADQTKEETIVYRHRLSKKKYNLVKKSICKSIKYISN